METLYLDVYFLINFTVDILALHFASSLISVTVNKWSLIFSGILGAFYAVIAIIFDNGFLKLFFALIFATLITVISAMGVSVIRKLKFFAAFLLLETLIGGIVFFAYSILDEYFYKYIGTEGGTGENRGVLIMAIIVLLSIGVFKLFLSLFSGKLGVSCARVVIKESGFEYEFDALADSGNLAKDPIDMTPVLFIKEDFAKKKFSGEFLKLDNLALNNKYNKKIRIIPTSFSGGRLVYGIRPDEAFVIAKDGKREKIKVVIAIDKEGGTYGGYNALLPTSAVDNVVL